MANEELRRLVDDLQDWTSEDMTAEVREFLDYDEPECALDLLWACVSIVGRPLNRLQMSRLRRLGEQVNVNLAKLDKEFPIQVAVEDD